MEACHSRHSSHWIIFGEHACEVEKTLHLMLNYYVLPSMNLHRDVALRGNLKSTNKHEINEFFVWNSNRLPCFVVAWNTIQYNTVIVNKTWSCLTFCKTEVLRLRYKYWCEHKAICIEKMKQSRVLIRKFSWSPFSAAWAETSGLIRRPLRYAHMLLKATTFSDSVEQHLLVKAKQQIFHTKTDGKQALREDASCQRSQLPNAEVL